MEAGWSLNADVHAELFFAARLDDDVVVARLLAEDPSLIVQMHSARTTPLHHAASSGAEKVVAQLLAASSALANQPDGCGNIPLYNAVNNGHDRIVSLLLPSTKKDSMTDLLHLAASKGDKNIVNQLLAANPDLISQLDWCARNPLFDAAIKGHHEIVAHLLVIKPTLIDGVDRLGRTPLHYAAGDGHIKVVEQLLTARPSLVDVLDGRRRTVLHWAVRGGHESVVEKLLATKQDLLRAVDVEGCTPLHSAILLKKAQDSLIERLWRLYPEALWVMNSFGLSPFGAAISAGNDHATGMFQWKLSFDEIVHTFWHPEWLRPVMEKECECLLAWLNKDVMGELFEFLGFDTARGTHKRAKLS